MSLTPIQRSKLLHHNSDFKVLICLECEYAIQKRAIGSHLLKHKIYRGERQGLLAEIAKLNLLDPEDVQYPQSRSRPINGLAVQQGYRCTLNGCQVLTVSAKRMKRHWGEVHGQGTCLPPLEQFACSVNLQSFFKGTKIRYFEVSSRSENSVGNNDVGWSLDEATKTERDQQRRRRSRVMESLRISHAPARIVPRNSLSPGINTASSSINLDLDTLKYFHHLVTTVVFTLPGPPGDWQTKISKALVTPGIMCGLLAISACHLIVTETNLETLRSHKYQQERFSLEFHRSRSCTDNSTIEQAVPATHFRYNTFADQISALLRFAQCAAAQNAATDHPYATLPSLGTILDNMRDCTLSESSHSEGEIGESLPQSLSASFQRFESDARTPYTLADQASREVLERLQRLPHRMVQTLGKPDNAEDVAAILAAIAALITCFKISFASDNSATVWKGVSLWLAMTPRQSHFNSLLTRHEPGSMIVVAHWAAIMIQRAECCGHWYLKGVVKRVVTEAVAHLSLDFPAAVCLVKDLVL